MKLWLVYHLACFAKIFQKSESPPPLLVIQKGKVLQPPPWIVIDASFSVRYPLVSTPPPSTFVLNIGCKGFCCCVTKKIHQPPSPAFYITLIQQHWSRSLVFFSDKRVDGYFMMSSFIPTLVLTILYFYIVKIAGPNFMRNRKPYNLRTVMLVYNFAMVILSGYICWEVNCKMFYLNHLPWWGGGGHLICPSYFLQVHTCQDIT